MAHLKEVQLDAKTFRTVAEYKEITPEVVREIQHYAPHLKNSSVIHINATPIGGGVAELLASQIGHERSLGIDSHWFVIDDVPEEFFDITKKVHNMLQGKSGALDPSEEELYRKVNHGLARSLLEHLSNFKNPLIIIHDPQPLGIIAHAELPRSRMALRLHIDLSTPNQTAIDFFRPLILQYPRLVLTSKEYMPPFRWYPEQKITLIPPAIDPLTEKNRPMTQEEADALLAQFGIDPAKPLLTQVSRFDPWKDPLGVIEAFREVQKKIPDAQLALAGFVTAKDDPEAMGFVEKTERAREDDRNIFLFSDPAQLGNISNDTFINALVRGSDVVFQKSLREGFGLTCTEALWKYKPVISGNTVGGRMQIAHKENGFLIDTPLEATEAALVLLNDIPKREKMGKAAHESAKKQFMVTHHILNHLKLYADLNSLSIKSKYALSKKAATVTP